MRQDVVRFGVIGCGLMGREFASAASRWLHLEGMAARPEIVAVCDTNAELMQWFADRLPSVKQTTSDYRQLLANPEVDAVYCAVPHVLHGEIYPAVIRAGKHMLGEKPFGMDAEQNREISRAAAARPDVLVRCSSEMPFYPGAQRVIELVRSGDMGDIVSVEAGFLHSTDMDRDKPINWKRIESVNGAYGCMGDLGMHVLHVPLRLGWRPKTVYAQLSKLVRERPDGKGTMQPCTTWDNATLACQVEADDRSFPMTLKTWRIAPGEANTWYLRVLGMRRSAHFTTKSPRQWQWLDYQGGRQAWQVEDLGYSSVFPAITGKIFEFGFTDAVQQMWAAFVDEISGRAASGFGCVTPDEARAHHAVLTAALTSGRTNTTVDVAYGDTQ